MPESGDLPTNVEAFTNDADDDLREGDERDGGRAEDDPPTPWSEFIEAFLCSVGEAERVSRLMRLGLRRTVLAGDALPFGDGGGILRWLILRVEGEEGCDEGGRAVEEEDAALIESRFSAFESEASFLFIDGDNEEGDGGSFTMLL